MEAELVTSHVPGGCCSSFPGRQDPIHGHKPWCVWPGQPGAWVAQERSPWVLVPWGGGWQGLPVSAGCQSLLLGPVAGRVTNVPAEHFSQ